MKIFLSKKILHPAWFRLSPAIITVLLILLIPWKNETSLTKWVPPALEPNDWMAMQRLYPYDRINTAAFHSATQQAQNMMNTAPALNNPWIFCGPDNIGGRITDIESPAGSPSTPVSYTHLTLPTILRV